MRCAPTARRAYLCRFCAFTAVLLVISPTIAGCAKGGQQFKAARPDQKAVLEPHLKDTLTGESYERLIDNPFMLAAQNPLSTFSIDVDTASYSNVRRFLKEGQLPPRDAVRVEELINYFHYDYPQPRGEHPVGIHTEVAECPWNPQHQLVRIALQGKTLHTAEMPPRNLVFLVDTSGSMNAPNRLPLLKQALGLLTKQLNDRDRVAIVSYAGVAELVLDSTPGNHQESILAAIGKLNAYGSTNGGGGLMMAYRIAEQNFVKGGANRVIVGTDGDFNVGVTGAELIRVIEEKRKTGIFLSVLGFGMGNLKDRFMEQLAQHGNGQYAYIDTFAEAQKVFVHDIANLVPIAKDVKLQIEFNPLRVQAYRLIGYENRLLQHQDFNDDTKDAGDMGAGHTVTAFYEIVPPGIQFHVPGVDPLKYQASPQLTEEARKGDLLTVKVRYIPPEEMASRLLTVPVQNTTAKTADASVDFRFAAAVAQFGLLLRHSEYKGEATYVNVLDLARGALGQDVRGYRAEFIELVQMSRKLTPER